MLFILSLRLNKNGTNINHKLSEYTRITDKLQTITFEEAIEKY